MCGIVGILSNIEAAPALISALQNLEYRGYDSAGVATIDENGKLHRRRAVGKIKNLSDLLFDNPLRGMSGIGHTRWATHGPPTLENTHPHRAGPVAVVHNGIVENFRVLREALAKDGYTAKSETDTEVIALSTQRMIDLGAPPIEAAFKTIKMLEGAFSLVFLFEDERNLLVAARKGSPLVIGVGDQEKFISSDAIALASLTNKMIYLEEGDIAIISREDLSITNIEGFKIDREIQVINLDSEDKYLSKTTILESNEPQPRTAFNIDDIKSIASKNSISIYLNIIALEEQVCGFVERVRGSNSLDTRQKDRYLSFLVQLQKNIGDLASSLPDANEELDQKQAEVTATYLEKYWEHLTQNIDEFLSPEKTAGLTVPLGIVAVSTGIGALFGQPIAGSILGAWLAGRASPEKVVGKFLEGTDRPQEPK